MRYAVFFVAAVACMNSGLCRAQNISNYADIPEPYLFLIREPAVQADLKLTAEQRRQLKKINEQIDGPLLALRNWPGEKAGTEINELLSLSRQRLGTVFDNEQKKRLKQIGLRIRGIRFVLLPDVADKLALDKGQRQQINDILSQTQETLVDLQKKAQNINTQAVQEKTRQARVDERKRVLDRLNGKQRKTLLELLGRNFDLASLSQVAFKAPELLESGGWINTRPLTLASAKGQVIVLHFFAFA